MSLASSSLWSIGKDRKIDYSPILWLSALMTMSTECDGSLEDVLPPPTAAGDGGEDGELSRRKQRLRRVLKDKKLF